MISNFRYFQISNYRRRRFVQLSEKQGGQSRGWQPKPGHLTLMNAAAAGSPHADACHPAPADQLDHSKAAFKRSPPPIAAARLRLWNSPHTHTHTHSLAWMRICLRVVLLRSLSQRSLYHLTTVPGHLRTGVESLARERPSAQTSSSSVQRTQDVRSH